jgi:hypothetical protein
VSMLGTLGHLVRRFFEVLSARRPRPDDQARVAGLLSPAEAALFWDQAPADQAHAVACLARVERARPGRTDLARAALLHDVGKRHAGLGVAGRIVASLCALLGVPAQGRLRTYLSHGALGARDLTEAGSDSLVIAFAAGHHGPTPDGVDPGDWAVLIDADER